MSSQAYQGLKGAMRVTSGDSKRLYKELMKAAMRISNPKMRIVAYDSIRTEFKVRMHLTDEFAKADALTKGVSSLETLRDQRTHPFLTLNEDGIIQAPLIEDPNAPKGSYVPGPALSMLWAFFFIGGGGFVYGAVINLMNHGSILTSYMDAEGVRPIVHKGVPTHFEGTELEWKHQPPTGPEIVDFRNKIMYMREKEAHLEAELLNLEAKCFAEALTMKEDYNSNPEEYKRKIEEERRAEETSGKKRFWFF